MKKSFYLSGLLVLCFVLSSVVANAAVPTVHTDPHDSTVCAGIPATFTVFATDTPGTLVMTYKWQVSTDGTTWSTLRDTLQYTGSGTSTLTVQGDTALNGRWYRAIVTNTSGADTSAAGRLTVIPQPYAGVITGASIVCGSTSSQITMTDAVSGGVWSSANTSIATVDASGVVTGVAQGSDTIKYTYTNACGSNVARKIIRVDVTASILPITGPSATCVGSFITLMNANTTGVGTWSSSNNSIATVSSAGVVTGAGNGNVTITYDFTNACNTVSSTKSIQVDVVANHGTISGPTEVCAGSQIQLAESVSGGVWISGSTGVANVDAFGNVTGVSQGSTVISYYLSNACGGSVATYTVTTSIPASVITGGDSVGIGAHLTLSNATVNGAWSNDNTAIAVIDAATGDAVGLATGTTTVAYSVSNACGVTSATMTLYVGTPPAAGTITGADSVCIGSNIRLSDNVSAGVWSAVNGHGTISPVGDVTGVSKGLDTFYYTMQNAFGSTRARKIVYINHTPILTLTGPVAVAIGQNVFFRGIPYGGTFSHTNNTMGQFVSFPDSVHQVSYGSYVVLAPGTDVITYHYTNACGSADSTFTIHLALSGVNNVGGANASLNVYPNPNQGEFTLNLSSTISEDAVVTVTNIVGQKVKEFTIATNRETNITLDQPA
jgi:hypothetical protein